jgi:hypothetical protein
LLASLFALAAGLPTSVPAANFMSYLGLPLTQDFDALTSTGLSTSTVDGWWVAAIGARVYVSGDPNNALPADGRLGPLQAAYPANPIGADRVTAYSDGTTANDGVSAAANANGGLYNYGMFDATDRALGMIPSGTINVTNPNNPLHSEMLAPAASIEAAIINDSGADLAGITMLFTEERWHTAQTAGAFTPARAFYSLDSGSTWIEMPPEFQFLEIGIAGTNSGVDGNLPTEQLARGGTLMFPAGQTIQDGSEFYIRWVDYNDSGTDQGAGIDNWSFTGIPVPEPASCGLAFAGMALMMRRRRD